MTHLTRCCDISLEGEQHAGNVSLSLTSRINQCQFIFHLAMSETNHLTLRWSTASFSEKFCQEAYSVPFGYCFQWPHWKQFDSNSHWSGHLPPSIPYRCVYYMYSQKWVIIYVMCIYIYTIHIHILHNHIHTTSWLGRKMAFCQWSLTNRQSSGKILVDWHICRHV